MSARLQQPIQMVDYQYAQPWDHQPDSVWGTHDDGTPANFAAPIYSSSAEDNSNNNYWLGVSDFRSRIAAGLAVPVPSSPSDIPDSDPSLTPLTPILTSPAFEGVPLFDPMQMDFGIGLPAYQPADDMGIFSLLPPQLPSTPPSSMRYPDFDLSPVGPYPIPVAPEPKRARVIAPPRIYKCDVDGCSISFTSSRRDIERHKASVHGPPVVLECGESLSYRPDNIARHRKKCETCSAAHMRKCEEDGGEQKLRPGRKRKAVDMAGEVSSEE